ncbi:hypothetical protein BKA65DRAFT_117777 [Rhexocercosporidium sp. MPI-PUGE-AT-0058]|nr:hypothetical protein BKA65DRAFT_117777 [Rhexocercosporidium sp. MPI-PUGE-AT-0058]
MFSFSYCIRVSVLSLLAITSRSQSAIHSIFFFCANKTKSPGQTLKSQACTQSVRSSHSTSLTCNLLNANLSIENHRK